MGNTIVLHNTWIAVINLSLSNATIYVAPAGLPGGSRLIVAVSVLLETSCCIQLKPPQG